MDIATFDGLTKPTEAYHRVNVSQITFNDTEVDIAGVGKFTINDDLFTTICRFVGIPKGLNQNLRKVDKALWEQVVRKLYQNNENELVIRILDGALVGISNYEKDPVGNSKFISRVVSYFDDAVGIDVEDIMYVPTKQHSSVLVTSAVSHDYQGTIYKLGVVIENDSLYGVQTKLAILESSTNSVIYAVPRILNISSARYNRTSDTGLDALNNMLVTLTDIMTSEHFSKTLTAKLDEVLYQETAAKATYEDYHRARVAIIRNCSVSGFDEDTVKKITDDFRDLFDFYKNYPSVMESDAIWRTTAYSDQAMVTVRKFIGDLSNNVSMTYGAVRDLRSLAGELLFNKPLYRSIAIRK